MATRPRLTRQQATAQTRQELLDAGHAVLVERGYHAASIYEIAERAGYTIGALYSHFGGKEGLLLELIDQHFARHVEELRLRLAEDADASASVAVGSEFWTDFLERDPDLFVLFIEFWSVAVRDAKIRRRLTRSYRSLREALAELIEQAATRMGVPLPAPAEEIAIALDALADGFALHTLADRERIPPDLLARSMRALLTGMVVEANGGLAAVRPALARNRKRGR